VLVDEHHLVAPLADDVAREDLADDLEIGGRARIEREQRSCSATAASGANAASAAADAGS
jgi:hypothetical protein